MTGMEILFMVFMVIVSVMALFAVMVVLRDIVKEILESRRERDKCNCECHEHKPEAPAPAPVVEEVVPEPIPEPTPEPEAPAEEPEVVEDADGTIKFSTGQQQTLDEKYLELSSEARGWYDEIIRHAAIVEGSKRFKNARYEEYKVGNGRLVRMLIKRGVIHCEFLLHNADFKNFVNENKISVKQGVTVMRIENRETVDAAKSSIDIAVAAIAEEKEYKKQLAREKRKAAKEAAETAEAAAK